MKYKIEIESEGLLVKIQTQHKDSAHRFINTIDEIDKARSEQELDRVVEKMMQYHNKSN